MTVCTTAVRLARRGLMLLLVAGAAGLVAAQDEADPPGRVGRLADLEGEVLRFDLDEQRWSAAERNRPLTTGDRIATGRQARAELRIGSTTLTLDQGSELELQRLDDEQVRLRLHQGSKALRLRSAEMAGQTHIGTDEAWLQPLRGGLYRIDRDDDTTQATSWRGDLRVEDEPSLTVAAGRRLQLWREGPGGGLRHRWRDPLDDGFAQRVLAADHEEGRGAATQYVSPEMTGWEDLDRHGRWDQHPDLGAVWIPAGVGVDWVPYRDGRWAWVRPWGWTWIDAAPWGFAPFHYGRWVEWRARWVWVPGRYVARPVFAPALVTWIDAPAAGIGLRIGGPTLSWVPLAPWEPYRPWYRASPRHPSRIDPPEWQRRRPPPDVRGGFDYGRGGVPRGVTVVPSDVLKPRPAPSAPLLPPPRVPREREPDRDRDRDRGDRGERGDRDRDDRDRRPLPSPPAVVHPPVMGTPAPAPRPPRAGPAPEAPRTVNPPPPAPAPAAGLREPTRPAAPPPRAATPSPPGRGADRPEPERPSRDEGRGRPEGRNAVR